MGIRAGAQWYFVLAGGVGERGVDNGCDSVTRVEFLVLHCCS
jgi:hypothetical protein